MRISNRSRVMPALLTRLEPAPCSYAIASTSASTPPPSATESRLPAPPCAASRSPIACAPASVVAVPTTFAPSAASSSAIAAPMPRLAPVTSATSPSSSLPMMCVPRLEGANLTRNAAPRVATAPREPVHGFEGSARRGWRARSRAPVGQRGLEIAGGAERAAIDRLVDALDQARQHLARAAFGDTCRAGGGKRLHACGPAHRQVELAHQRVADFGKAGVCARVDVLHHRDPWLAPVVGLDRLGEEVGGFAHQRRMRGHADAELDR